MTTINGQTTDRHALQHDTKAAPDFFNKFLTSPPIAYFTSFLTAKQRSRSFNPTTLLLSSLVRRA